MNCLTDVVLQFMAIHIWPAAFGVLQAHREQPVNLQHMLRMLWAEIDRGGFSAALATQLLRLNSKLFKATVSDGCLLPFDQQQIGLLIDAARPNGRKLESAIFGTWLERALDSPERHAVGAHYTPRGYASRAPRSVSSSRNRDRWQRASFSQ